MKSARADDDLRIRALKRGQADYWVRKTLIVAAILLITGVGGCIIWSL